MILRELSFSGQTMTTTQIAKAIDYNSDRTKTALSRVHAHVNYSLIGKRPPEPLYHYRMPPDARAGISAGPLPTGGAGSELDLARRNSAKAKKAPPA
jgi:hypothetical protein